jgi:hypothetical protein
MYEVAARHAAGEEKIDLLIAQSDALRFRGRWQEARRALEQAASLARTLGLPGREAIALIHLERLTWSYGLDESEITQQIRDVIGRLPANGTPRADARRTGPATQHRHTSVRERTSRPSQGSPPAAAIGHRSPSSRRHHPRDPRWIAG